MLSVLGQMGLGQLTGATALALGVAVAALLLGLGETIWMLRRTRHGRAAAGGERVVAADGSLGELERRLDGHTADIVGLREAVQALQEQSLTTLSRVAVVRYNAFNDTGSELSFSLALLNDQGSGLVLTGLWGRDDSRVLAKPVAGRTSSYLLSQEEQAAIDLAMRDRARGTVREDSLRSPRLSRAPSSSR